MLETEVFAIHYTLNLVYQTAHWLSKGNQSYSDHLLYERLYNEVSGTLDNIAEKWIPIFGEDSINPSSVSSLSAEHLSPLKNTEPTPENLIKITTKFQKEALRLTTELYEKKKKENMSLGMDDFLMSLCSDHEHRLYLLSQRVK